MNPLRTRQTPRLLLRPFEPRDDAPFAAMNADPKVMEHFPAPLSRDESDALAARIRATFDAQGYGLWALERRSDGAFLGFTGLAHPTFEAHFTPCLEVGWRLVASAWGQGYATEAAREALTVAFDHLGLDEVVSFTAVPNERSRAVMERLGMMRDPRDDFDHPNVPAGHRLVRHVLYRKRASDASSSHPANRSLDA